MTRKLVRKSLYISLCFFFIFPLIVNFFVWVIGLLWFDFYSKFLKESSSYNELIVISLMFAFIIGIIIATFVIFILIGIVFDWYEKLPEE